MRKFSRRTTIVSVGMALVLATGALAFAFWTGIGGGTGQAATGTGPTNPVIVNQNSPTTPDLVPGGPTANLSGTFNNSANTSGVFVNQLHAAISGISGAGSDPTKPACTTADYQLTPASGFVTINAEVPPGGTLPWSGFQIQMLNTAANQDNCKGAQVDITYTIS